MMKKKDVASNLGVTARDLYGYERVRAAMLSLDAMQTAEFAEEVRDSEVSDLDSNCILVVPDLHVGWKTNLFTGQVTPTHDKKAINVVVACAKSLQPKRIVFLGDFLENTAWSTKFISPTEAMNVTNSSFSELKEILGLFRSSCPDSDISAMNGNHDIRLIKYAQTRAPEIDSLMLNGRRLLSLANFVPFDKLKINFFEDYPARIVIDGIQFMHGHGSANFNRVYANAVMPTAYGHTHKLAIMYKRIGDSVFPVVNCGFLGSVGGLAGNNGDENHHQGFATFSLRGSSVTAQVHSIENGSVEFMGSIITG